MKKNRSSGIIKNVASNYLRQILEILGFLILTPFIVQTLGKEEFALWSLLMVIVSFLRLADMGLGTAVVKHIADARGKEDFSRLQQITATLFWTYTGMGLVLFILGILIEPLVTNALMISENFQTVFTCSFYIVLFRSASLLPLGMFVGVFVGHQKQYISNFIKLLGTFLYIGGALYSLYFHPSLVNIALAYCLSNLVSNFVAMLLAIKKIPSTTISFFHFRRNTLREIISFSWYFFVIQISALIHMRVDTLIINGFLSLSSVALYTVAIRIADKSSSFCRQLTNALSPVIAELKGAEDHSNIKAVFLKGTKLSVAMTIPLLVGLIYFSTSLITLWMGNEFSEASFTCQILIVAMIINVIHGNAANVLAMSGHEKFLAKSIFAGQILNLILTLILVPYFGMEGAASATLVTTLLIDVLVTQRYAGKIYSISLLDFYKATVFPAIIPCILMLGFFVMVNQIFPVTSFLFVALWEICGCVIFASAFVFFGLNNKERKYYHSKLLKRISKKTGSNLDNFSEKNDER